MQSNDRNNQLLQIVNDPASTAAEVAEAQRELTGTELPQDDEDRMILAHINYKHRDGTPWRSDDFPAWQYEPKVKALSLAVTNYDCLFVRDRAEAEHHVAMLDALAKRTHSEEIRSAALRCIATARKDWQL